MPPFEVPVNPRTSVLETNVQEKCSNTSIAKREETLTPLYWLLEQNRVMDHFQPADVCSPKPLKQTQVLILNGLWEWNSY